MALKPDEVQKIAHLARINIDDGNIPAYTQSLSSILDLVAQLQAADTDAIAPMAHPLDASQRLRVDAISESNERDHYQKIAPTTEDGLYLVPKVIE